MVQVGCEKKRISSNIIAHCLRAQLLKALKLNYSRFLKRHTSKQLLKKYIDILFCKDQTTHLTYLIFLYILDSIAWIPLLNSHFISSGCAFPLNFLVFNANECLSSQKNAKFCHIFYLSTIDKAAILFLSQIGVSPDTSSFESMA